VVGSHAVCRICSLVCVCAACMQAFATATVQLVDVIGTCWSPGKLAVLKLLVAAPVVCGMPACYTVYVIAVASAQ
jgi:hypothetical protein